MLRRFIKQICGRLNRTPVRPLLAAYYRLGLNQLLQRLESLPEVDGVYGCGSYFDGHCVYGQSDVDLIIVIGDKYNRLDGTHARLAKLYRWVSSVFPFLGNWSEQEESVIYLNEIGRGDSLPASFVLRAQQDELVHLQGSSSVEQYLPRMRSSLAVLEEVSSLLRLPLVRCESNTKTPRFRSSIFRKLSAARESLGLSPLEVDWLSSDSVDVAEMFGRLVDEALCIEGELCRAQLTTAQFCSFSELSEGSSPETSMAGVLQRTGLAGNTRWLSRPLLLSVEPTLLFFAMEQAVPLVSLPRDAFPLLRRLITEMRHSGAYRDAVLVDVAGFLLVLHREQEGTSVVPLHPLRYPLPYCRMRGKIGYSLPQIFAMELEAGVGKRTSAVVELYRSNVHWIEKYDFPCTYIEDEYLSLRDALSIWRSFLFFEERIDFDSPGSLVTRLSERHPEASGFLGTVESYYAALADESAAPHAANNIYRCLHEFTWQLLDRKTSIELSSVQQSLGITVGIITRNRAGVLRQALRSIAEQHRKPDEVLIVDNGSEDDTRECIDSFCSQLPIRYYFLQQPSIPQARNYVIEHASQDVISFTDDDCIAHPQWLASVERAFLRAENVGVVGGWVYHQPSEEASALDSYYQMFHHRKP